MTTTLSTASPNSQPPRQPLSQRWRPLRAGLMNLYLYEDEVLHFERGRLLLRGNNATGKSRILALQLPFLFDGEVHSWRVEPDGDKYKRIEWHLLMGGKFPDRIGYTWLEFGRQGDDGEACYLTIGIGMHAVMGKGAPKLWFFLTDRRKGIDLSLKNDTNTPFTRERLERHLDGRGRVLTSAREYRRAVDAALFELGEHRYRALIELLIQLRKPQLSRKLDAEQLSGALSEALPPLPDALLGDIADAMGELDRDRDELAGYRLALAATQKFLPRYRHYLALAAKRQADQVRKAHSSYEGKLRELRQAERDHQSNTAQLKTIESQCVALNNELAMAAEQRRALERSDAMRAAEQLEAARDRARDRERAQERAEHTLSEQEERLVQCRQVVRQEQGELDTVVGACRARIQLCGELTEQAAMDEVWASAVAQAGLPESCERAHITSLRESIEQGTKARRREVEHLERRSVHADKARRLLERRRAECDKLTAELDEARSERAVAGAKQQQRRDVLLNGYERWTAELMELKPLPVIEIATVVDAWVAGERDDSPLAGAVSEARLAAKLRLDKEQMAWQQKLETLSQERDDLQKQRLKLLDGYHAPPPPPYTRDREHREALGGAPLWTLCDWRDEVTAEQRAGYEAALEAAGLLDALVSPEGGFLDDVLDDCVLSARRDRPERNLGQILSVTIDPADTRARSIRSEAVRAILEGIAISHEGDDPGEVWVSDDGRFRLGALEGHWHKAAAQHIGHAAREQRRRQQLAAVEQLLEQTERDVVDARTAIARLDERQACVERERRAAPSDSELRLAIVAVQHCDMSVSRLIAKHSEADRAAEQAHKDHHAAKAELQQSAAELGLGDWLGRLQELRNNLNEFRTQCEGLWPQLDSWERGLSRLEQSRRSVLEQERRQEGARTDSESATRDAAAALAAVRVLEETVGKDVQQVMEQLDMVKQRQHLIDQQLNSASRQREGGIKQVAAAEERVNGLKQVISEREQVRDLAAEHLQRLAATGILADADKVLDGLDGSANWSATRTVEVARQIEQLFSNKDVGEAAWERSRTELFRRTRDLENGLLPLGYQPSSVERAGVTVVSVVFQGAERTAGRLEQMFTDEIEERQRIFDAREREVIENHLIDELSTQLHEMLRQGEQLVDEMNREIIKRPMSTGMKLRFEWEPRTDGPEGLLEARRRLRATKGTWAPAERRAIGDFLKRLLDEVRADDQKLTWREKLALAFDYRSWHRFVIRRQQDGDWQRLTRRTHGTGSGGEKAIALTVPQLAAATAHYKSAAPTAPRLILLDEAFVGVDSDMRGKCMELLEAFDLDFIMTSEREWGCYAGLKGHAIYQLSTRPGVDAVHLTRWIWNGRERRPQPRS